MVLQRKFTDRINGYFSYSEGFNSGGVSAANINNVRTLFPYKPSTLKNTEIGMRSDLANGKVRFNWTVFDTIWARPPGRGRRHRPLHGCADADAADHERR